LQCRVGAKLGLNLGPTLLFKLLDLRVHLVNDFEELRFELLIDLDHTLY
jgi:hypothetical protein